MEEIQLYLKGEEMKRTTRDKERKLERRKKEVKKEFKKKFKIEIVKVGKLEEYALQSPPIHGCL
jgi:hypothetical protein